MLILSYAEPDSDLSLQLTAKLALLRVPAHSVSDLCAQLTLHVMLVKNCPVTLSSTLLPVYLASGSLQNSRASNTGRLRCFQGENVILAKVQTLVWLLT